MKLLIQQVNHACVSVEDKVISKINNGLLVYLGLTQEDTTSTCDVCIEKLLGFRLFPSLDGSKHFDLSVQDTAQDILVVSQFTLYGSMQKGRRPSFDQAMAPDKAKELYDYAITILSALHRGKVAQGEFGASMTVLCENNGPTNFIYEL